MKHHLTYKDDKSDKFWNIEVSGTSFTVTYGKTGTAGQTQTKTFGSKGECQKEAKKLLSEKLKKGYMEGDNFAKTKSASTDKKNEINLSNFLKESEFHKIIAIGDQLLTSVTGADRKTVLEVLCSACDGILIGLTDEEEEGYSQRIKKETGLKQSDAKKFYKKKFVEYKNELKKTQKPKSKQNKELLEQLDFELNVEHYIKKKSLEEICALIRKMEDLVPDDKVQGLIIDHVFGRMDEFYEKKKPKNFKAILDAYLAIVPTLGFPNKLVYNQFRVGEGIASLTIDAGVLFENNEILEAGLAMVPASITYKNLAFSLARHYAVQKDKKMLLQYVAHGIRLDCPKKWFMSNWFNSFRKDEEFVTLVKRAKNW
ncbi:WGR domain-containing protein [Leptospira mayottensis]|uniref:WGR domain protein n=2 Tax=Leptospira mayottensis TaxID=1137606 RepID=A0AA87SWY5_9LEPT|nr:WGR domain-containing protein [Leptospira mayottensis]AXR60923.1 WGR domain-containing protein [Leptospira mayottensis]AXR64794.1 WGR domain-containing protein [Leptospira mayottensis]AZQ02646.1 WGR domain-containing protein [Leptospira mayottensis 200901116]EKS00395.1 WGR domain protein [Leptospira mayottensis 200901122]TGN12034.1 WGR domain-containing protein [Leptospira mayottensis]